MKPSQVFSKTINFVWAKLALGVGTVIASGILFALCMLIGMISESVMFIMFILWIIGTGIISFTLNNYFGYMVKAGHVAVITEAICTGKVPENQFQYAKNVVSEKFVTSNVYFGIDKLISASVKQIQRVVGKITDLAASIPGMSTIKSLLDMFLEISLGYVDECCLGYTFYKKDQNVYKSGADGVVIYFQNWKTLLKDAAKTTVSVILVILVVTIVCFVLIGGLFKILGWSQIVAFILSLFLAASVKTAFVDSWGLVNMMTSYMQVAPTTEITFDLYSKLCGMSAKFKELFNKGGGMEQANIQNATNENSSRYCTQCGKEIEGNSSFCGGCGAQL